MSTISDITLRRCRLFFSLFVFVLIVYALMLVRIQALPPPAATKSALNWRIRREVMPARRGAIYTRDMTPLAISVPHYSVCADPYLIRDPDNVAHRLSLLLNMPYEEVRPKLAITKRGRPLRFVWIKRQVTEKIAKAIQAQIKAKTLRGVFIRRECKRVYPSGRLACQVVGFTNVDNVGCEGIEWKWNDVLAGIDGERRQEVNARAEPIPNGYYEERPPVDGKDIILTIDSVIQMHVEKVLRDVMKQADAKGATAIVMDIRTGELLAVANQPDFDLNQYRTSRPECRENKAAHFEYEPGSVFKLIIAAIGLEVGYLTESSRAYCNGNRKIGGMKISCWVSSGHGWQSLSDAIKNSCNVAMAQFAMRIPPDALYKYILKFGFAKRLGSGLPQEAPGWLDPLSTWRSSKIRRANLGYGYGILVTPLQLLHAIATIARGGVAIKPQIVRQIRNASGEAEMVSYAQTLGYIISPLTAAKVRKAMELAVTDGTGRKAQVLGYRIAGKTGTTKKVVPGAGYTNDRIICSFVGFFPATEPRIAAIIVIDEPKKYKWASDIAAPAFAAIVPKVAWRLNIEPSPHLAWTNLLRGSYSMH